MAISKRRQGNLTSTHERVLPSTLRGALANFALRYVSDDDEPFQQAFVEGSLRPSTLYPVAGIPGMVLDGEIVREAPLTLLTCKRFDKEHGVEDSLFATTHLALSQASRKPSQDRDRSSLDAMAPLVECPRCKNVLKPLGGTLIYDGNAYSPVAKPGKRLQTHVGLDRARRGAAQGILYSREVMNESTSEQEAILQTTVSGEEDLLEWLGGILRPGEILHIGNAISRGLGRCEVVLFDPSDPPASVNERIGSFNEQFSDYTGIGEHTLVSLTLETPAFFVDEFLFPQLSPEGAHLAQAFGSDERHYEDVLRHLKKVHQVARPYRHTGWNQLAGFPRSTEMGLQSGSVLVFEAERLDDALIDALTHIETAGIGLNREAGFGNVRVCDPIHTDLHQLSAVTDQSE